MKNLFITAVLVLIFPFVAFAQSAQTSPCPAISITGSSGVPIPDEPIIYTANIGKAVENHQVEYKWTIANGDIIEGQGTPTAKVLINDVALYKNLLVTFEVLGLPKGCPSTASESIIIDEPPPQALLVEEVSISQIEKAEVFKKPTVLDDDPNAQLYIIFR